MLSLLEFNIQPYLTWECFKHEEALGCKRLQQFTALLGGPFQLGYLFIDCVIHCLSFLIIKLMNKEGTFAQIDAQNKSKHLLEERKTKSLKHLQHCLLVKGRAGCLFSETARAWK